MRVVCVRVPDRVYGMCRGLKYYVESAFGSMKYRVVLMLSGHYGLSEQYGIGVVATRNTRVEVDAELF